MGHQCLDSKQKIHPFSTSRCVMWPLVRQLPVHLINPRQHSPPTFVVEETLHLHGGPGVGDAEHGAGHNALLGRRVVRGPHQAPVWLVVKSLQNLHSLAPAHCKLPTAAIAGHKVMDHHRQLTATGQLKQNKYRTEKWNLTWSVDVCSLYFHCAQSIHSVSTGLS